MESKFELFVALRYLRSKRKEVFISIITVISVLGVGLSVMVLDITLAVMTGFENELQTKLVDANAHVTVRKYGGDIKSYEEILEKVRLVPGVVAAYPYTYNQAMLSTPLGARGLILRGVSDSPIPREKLAKTLLDSKAIERLFEPARVSIVRPDGERDEISLPPLIIGFSLSNDLHLVSGTPITLISPRLTSAPQGLVPKLKRIVPVGRYKTGLKEYESGLAYMSMKDAQQFFGLGDAVTGIEITVDKLFEAPKIAGEVARSLGGDESGLYVSDWTEQNQGLWEAIKLEKRVYFLVLQLLVLIASFTIVSTLVMVVMEKSRDIAILKTMGATNSAIMKIFFSQGVIIGFVGIIFGTTLGVLGCFGLRAYKFEINEDIFSMKHVPVHMEWQNFVVVALAAFVITALAGIYPARRAARLRPADVLRFE